MANPYDFTSGFLSAVQIRSQEKQAEDIKQYRTEAIKVQQDQLAADKEFKDKYQGPYYKSLGDKNAIDIKAKQEELDLLQRIKKHPTFKKLLPDLIEPSGMPPESDSGETNPTDRKFGQAYDPNVAYAANGWSPVDGTNINSEEAIPTNSLPPATDRISAIDKSMDGREYAEASGTKPGSKAVKKNTDSPEQAPGKSMLDIVKDFDPNKAQNIYKTVYGASAKEFQELMGAFSLINFATGKATSKDLIDNVNVLKKMQAEGIGVAVQRGLAGDYKGALQAFSESGSDTGDGIKFLDKVSIENDVVGPVKGIKDKYDGLQITYTDGRKIVLDPRKLMTETVSLAETLKFEKDKANELNKDFLSNKQIDEASRTRALQYKMNEEAKQRQHLINELTNIETISKNRIANQEKLILDVNNQDYMGETGADLRKADLAKLHANRLLVTDIASRYVVDSKGLDPVSYSNYEAAVKDLGDPAMKKPSDPYKFTTKTDGQGKTRLEVFNVGGRQYVRHNNGAHIPLDYTTFGPQK